MANDQFVWLKSSPMKSHELFHRYLKSNDQGLTLIEVMVSLAILGILAALAAPSFSESIKRYRINAIKDDLIASMQVARFEAIRRGTPITLIRRTDCEANLVATNAWGCGWITVLGAINPTTREATTAEQDSALQITTVPTGYEVKHTAGSDRQVMFSRWGQAGVGQTFVITQSNDGNAGKATITLCMSSGGRTRIEKGATCS